MLSFLLMYLGVCFLFYMFIYFVAHVNHDQVDAMMIWIALFPIINLFIVGLGMIVLSGHVVEYIKTHKIKIVDRRYET